MPLDFRPDFDPSTAGIITDCNNLIPTAKGYRSGYTAAWTGVAALAAACTGSAALRKVDDTVRAFAGTASNLYELSGTSWTSVSKGGGYTSGTNRWRFAQVGNMSFATNYADTPQYTTSGAFADRTGMPKCAHICASGDFLLIAKTNEGTYGDDAQRWWCSALGDPTSWTPSLATQAATAQWTDTPGPITAMKPLGDMVVMFKARSIAVLSYQGPPTIWARRTIATDIGSPSSEGVIVLPDALYWIGFDNIYKLDAGGVPQPFGWGVKEWLFNRIDKSSYQNIIGLYDRYRSTLYWWYPTQASGGTIAEYLAYNLVTQKFGFGTMTVESAMEYISPSLTYDNLWAGLTFDTVPTTTFDDITSQNTGVNPAVFDSSHKLSTLTGSATTSSLTTGYWGGNDKFTLLKRVVPKFLTIPTSATMTPYWVEELGLSDTTGTAVTMGQYGKFDTLRSAKYHKFKFDLTGNHEITDIGVISQPSSRE